MVNASGLTSADLARLRRLAWLGGHTIQTQVRQKLRNDDVSRGTGSILQRNTPTYVLRVVVPTDEEQDAFRNSQQVSNTPAAASLVS
jgi:hypothetical protein